MCIGRGDDLDLPGLLHLGVQGQNFAHHLQHMVEHNLLIFLAKAFALVHQTVQRFVRQNAGVKPGQVEPDLQVAVILLGERFQSLVDRGRVAVAALVQQFLIARVARQNLLPVHIEEALQDKALVFFGQLRGGLFSHHPIQVLGPVFQVILDLADEHRREIEGHMHVRVLAHQSAHVVIVLGAVHAHPRTGVDPVVVFIIQRLVLVPDQVHIQRLVHSRGSSGRGGSRLGRFCRGAGSSGRRNRGRGGALAGG